MALEEEQEQAALFLKAEQQGWAQRFSGVSAELDAAQIACHEPEQKRLELERIITNVQSVNQVAATNSDETQSKNVVRSRSHSPSRPNSANRSRSRSPYSPQRLERMHMERQTLQEMR